MKFDQSVYTEIYSLQVGRDLDGIIAERVLGYHRETVPKDGAGENGGNEYLVPGDLSKDYQLPPKGPINFAFHAPQVSTRLEPGWRGAMWLWIDILAGRGWQCSLVHKPFEADPQDRWVFHGVRMDEHQEFYRISAHADTIELAICRFALFTVAPVLSS